MTKVKQDAIADAVTQAKVLQPKLAAATDQLNSRIREFEKALAELKLGVSASIRLWEDDTLPIGADLQFCKWSDSWRLVIREWRSDRLEDDVEPLLNSAREQRLSAVGKFPALVQALIKAAEVEIGRVADSSAAVDDLVKSLKPGPNE